MVEAPPYEPARLRSVNGEGTLRYQEAMTAYEAGAYAKAIPGLEQALELEPELAMARFYLGACYLLEDEPEPAIESLSRIADNADPQIREWALFYRAKAYLRLADVDSARRDLSEVMQLDGELRAEAEEVLEQLPR